MKDSSSPLEFLQADDIQCDDNDRNNKLEDRLHPILHLHALAGVGLSLKVLPAPSYAAGTEQYKYQRTERQQVVADNVILKIEERASLPIVRPATARMPARMREATFSMRS